MSPSLLSGIPYCLPSSPPPQRNSPKCPSLSVSASDNIKKAIYSCFSVPRPLPRYVFEADDRRHIPAREKNRRHSNDRFPFHSHSAPFRVLFIPLYVHGPAACGVSSSMSFWSSRQQRTNSRRVTFPSALMSMRWKEGERIILKKRLGIRCSKFFYLASVEKKICSLDLQSSAKR